MLDFGFATSDEICAELGRRLKAARLAQGIQQVELAARAGVSRGTVNTLENSGQSTLASIVRVAQALNLVDELQHLFELKARTIFEMERSEQGKRKRASRKRRPEGMS
ncbi:helix-turn-helix protein [Azoarcus sp. Aa7]|nr:helix-turn-helix protein [Azoarcus sp. Aa7]